MSYAGKTAHRPARKPGRHDSPARRLANLTAVAARVNTGQHTAADYLADTLGADTDFTRRYCGPFGKAAAKAHREQYAAEPAKSGLDVRGKRLVRVFTYPVEVLEKAALTYARTAELVAKSAPAVVETSTETVAERPAITAGALVSFLTSDTADGSSGIVTRVYRDEICGDVAEILMSNGRDFLQCLRFLTLVKPAPAALIGAS